MERFLFLSQSFLNSFTLCFVPWLIKKSKHVLLVCLNTWLIERINFLHKTTNTAGLLEEINKLTEVILISLGTLTRMLGTPPSTCAKRATKLSHLINLVNTLTSEEVQAIKIFFIMWEENLSIGSSIEMTVSKIERSPS